MLSIYLFKKIRKLKSLGMSQASIARKIQINPKTIAKYVRSNTPSSYQPRSVWTRVDLFLEFQDKVKKMDISESKTERSRNLRAPSWGRLPRK